MTNKNLKGFTLIELLISIFVLTIGIFAILHIFPIGTQIQKASQMATVASQLSQQKMEETISQSYFEISTGIIEENYGFDSNFSLYKRRTEITYFNPDDPTNPPLTDLGIKKIIVTVFWRSFLGVGEKEVVLATLIARK